MPAAKEKNAVPTQEFDPLTGGYIPVEAPDSMDGGYPAPAQISTVGDARLQRSFRKSSKGAGHYARIIPMGDYRLYLQTIDKETIRAITAADGALNEENKRITEAMGKGEISPDEAGERLTVATEQRAQAFYEALKGCLVGWDLPDDDGQPLPVTPENIEDLDLEAIIGVIQSAVSRQALGQDAGKG